MQGFLDHLGMLPDTMVVVTPQLGGVPFKMPQPLRISDLFEGYLGRFLFLLMASKLIIFRSLLSSH